MKPTTDITEILQSRAILYAGISSIFSSPVEQKFQYMHREEFRGQIIEAALRYDEQLENKPGNLHRVIDDLLTAFDNEKNALEFEYINVFGHTLSKNTAPYGLEHLQNQEIFHKTQSLADISGFYRAFGLQISAKERVDFISVEAEFLAYLIVKELLARQKNLDTEKIEVTRNAQVDFFKDHFAGWTAKFAKNIIEQAHISFYQHSGRLLQRFIESEKKVLGISK